MSRKDALAELIEKVDQGELKGWVDRSVRAVAPSNKSGYPSRHAMTRIWAAYNGSLESVMRLHDDLLPGWSFLVRKGDEEDTKLNWPDGGPDKFFANVWRDKNPNYSGNHYTAWLETPARSWLLAILKALHAMEAAE